jgi:amidase
MHRLTSLTIGTALAALAFPAAIAVAQDGASPSLGDGAPRPISIEAPPATAVTIAASSDIGAMQEGMAAGQFSSADLVREYLRQIAAVDDAGPQINAVIATYPGVIAEAEALDAERRAGRVRGPLHGIPILIKDNVEAIGPLPTTAGSLLLADNVTGRDAPLVARLRAAGAIILGRTNLSEWANFRDDDSTSGWSAIGGLTRNPHSPDRSACGSSSGSGAAIAAGMAAAAIGTETDGSIVCPAGTNGIVGFKPTVGLVSRRHIIPISASQDTAGPMTFSVRDAAIMLTVMAGTDPEDPATREADARRSDYAAALSDTGLRGMRIGVMRDQIGSDPRIATLFDAALSVMRQQGAVIVEISEARIDRQALGQAEFTVLLTEFREDLNAYLRSRPQPRATDLSLADIIQFNRAIPLEMRWFGQRLFEQAEATGATGGRNNEAYRTALTTARRLAGPEGIDRLRREHNVDILVAVTNGPAWAIDLVNGDRFVGPSASQLPAVAGYPHLTVPMGRLHGLPIGLSFIGTRWDDARVLNAGHAYAQARGRTLPAAP